MQQIRNEPDKGWDGILATRGQQSTLTLSHSNAEHDGFRDALGWGEVCPGSPSA